MDTAQLDIFNTQQSVIECYSTPERMPTIPKIVTKPSVITSLRQPQVEIVDGFYKEIAAGKKKIVGIALMGVGKAQPLESKVLTPYGFKLMGDISVGDFVIGSDGKPTKVTGVFPQGVKPVYKALFSDESSVECCDDHLWYVETAQERYSKLPGRAIRLSDIRQAGIRDKYGNSKWFIPMTKPVEFYEHPDIYKPLDPYYLGLILGDGCISIPSHGGNLISNPDPTVHDELRKVIPDGYCLDVRSKGRSEIACVVKSVGKYNPYLKNSLENLKLLGTKSESKFIPDSYLYSSFEDRLSLLQGLMDTDGCPSGSGSDYVTVSQKLGLGVKFIVESLGGTAIMRTKKTHYKKDGVKIPCQLAYRIQVKLPPEINPFRCASRMAKHEPSTKYHPRRCFKSIELVGEKECQCISVEAENRLYLTDNFIVTHNTVIAGWMIRDAVKASKKCVFFVHFDTLVSQTIEEFGRLGLTCSVLQGNKRFNKSADIAIVSLQSLESRLSKGESVSDIIGYRDVHFFDECHDSAFRDSFDVIDKHYPNALKFGLTATPWRTSKKEWLGQKFETSVEGWQPPKMIKEGISVHSRCYAIGGGVINVTEADVGFDGDYSEGLMGKQASEADALEYTFQEWKRLSGDRPTIMVGSTIDQAKATTAKFLEHGITTEMVIGSTSKKKRKEIFARVKVGQTQVLTSVGALTAGFNLPILSSILFVRATKSKNLFFQCCGRPARSCPGKNDYLILDFGGNLKRFGDPMDYQDYSIDGEMPIDNGENFKECPNCGHSQRIFNAKCEKCGYEFSTPEEIIEEDTQYQELVEYTDGLTQQKIKFIRAWRKNAFKVWSINRQVNDETSPDKAIELFLNEYGHNPPPEWVINSVLTKRYSKSRLRDYIAYLKAHIKNEKYAKGWLNYHYRLETGEDMPVNQLDLLLRDV